MESRHINNLISLVENAIADALNGNSENVAKAINHLNNTDLYGDLPTEVKNHFAFSITNYLNTMETNSSAPFHKVDMSRYLSDPSYNEAMTSFCKFAVEYSEQLLIEYADQLTLIGSCIESMLDEMEILISINHYCNMYFNVPECPSFYVSKWFLVYLLKKECKQGAFDNLMFTISLIRECK